MNRFLGVIHNWNNLIRYERNLAFFTVGYQQATAMAPIIFALPKFLAGELMLGGLMQLRQAFSSVAGALSWFIFSYKEIAAWQATVTRLYNFVVLLEHDHEPEVADLNDKQTKLKANLSLFMQDDSLLIQDINFSVKAGELTVIEGCSGLGKSTLLRALSGHWPYFKGDIQRAPNVCWVPQRMYLPFARLDSLLAYPCQPNQFSAKEYEEVLHLVGLDKIKNQLSLETDWTTRLSGGEQQRLIFARLLLNKPELILLDETTSALDEQNALNMLQLLKQHLPTAGIALVSHQRFTHVIADNVISLKAPTVSSSQPAGATEYVS